MTTGLDKLNGMKDAETDRQLFLNAERRELAHVQGASPQFSHHSLLVQAGGGEMGVNNTQLIQAVCLYYVAQYLFRLIRELLIHHEYAALCC